MSPQTPDPADQTPGQPARPAYQPPKIVTFTSEEILEQVGPALACTISDGGIG